MKVYAVCMQNLDNNCVWNIFSQVVAMSQNIRHNRFCLRLAMKVSHDALNLGWYLQLCGNICYHLLTHLLSSCREFIQILTLFLITRKFRKTILLSENGRCYCWLNCTVGTMNVIKQPICCVHFVYSSQHPDHLALSILNGHNAMVAGSYKHAVGESRSLLCIYVDLSQQQSRC